MPDEDEDAEEAANDENAQPQVGCRPIWRRVQSGGLTCIAEVTPAQDQLWRACWVQQVAVKTEPSDGDAAGTAADSRDIASDMEMSEAAEAAAAAGGKPTARGKAGMQFMSGVQRATSVRGEH